MAGKMTNTNTQRQETGMILVISYVALFFSSSGVLWLAHLLFPTNIVLGTHALSFWWAIGMSMAKLSLLTTFAIPFVHEIENRRGRMYSSTEWMIAYFALNFVGLWGISRFSEQFGLGVTSWFVVAVLAVVMDLVQGVVMMSIQKMKDR